MRPVRILAVLLLTCSVSWAAEPAINSGFPEQVKKHFARWDGDKNGELSLEEVNRQVINPQVKGPEAAAIVALRRAMRNSKNDLTKVTAEELLKRASRTGEPNFNALYTTALNKIEKNRHELFPHGKPSLDAMNQGKLGDCFCLAPLGALVHRNPDDVAVMIRPKEAGKYEVRFGRHALVVDEPTDCELALSGGTQDGGIWLNVYEKAVGEYRLKQLPDKERPITALDLLSKGGSAGTMVEVVTGHKIERFSLQFAKNEATTPDERTAQLAKLREQLTAAFVEKRLVTAGTVTKDKRPPNILGNHAYAILGYDRAKDTITVWNPHGQTFTPKGAAGLEHGYPTVDGRFSLPLTEFVTVFSGLAFETSKPSE